MTGFEKELQRRLARANAAVVREAEQHFKDKKAGWPLDIGILQEDALSRVLPEGFSFEVLNRLKEKGYDVVWDRERGLLIQRPKRALRKSKT